jgi:hypothetical protein
MARRFKLTSPSWPKLTENDVEKACLDLLLAKGLYPVRLNSGLFPTPDSLCENCRPNARWVRNGEPGIPDYCIPNWFLECKAPGGKLSEEQRIKIVVLRRYWDLDTAVVHDVGELADWLAKLKR